MTTTWEITKNEIKRSQQPTPDSDQFHTTNKSHFTALLMMLIKLGGTIFGKRYHLG